MSTIRPYTEQGAALRALREESGLTQAQLAQKVELSTIMIRSLEAGKILPSDNTKVALGRVFGEETINALGWPRAYSPLKTNYRLKRQFAESTKDSLLANDNFKEGELTNSNFEIGDNSITRSPNQLPLTLQALRLALPGPPKQADIAVQLGITPDQYRQLEKDHSIIETDPVSGEMVTRHRKLRPARARDLLPKLEKVFGQQIHALFGK